MSAESNIILITNDSNVVQSLKSKLILLREVDNLLTTNYSEAVKNIKTNIPDTILLYCSKEKPECIKLIKALRGDEITKDISILLIVDEYSQDFILNAYDENITDYLILGANDEEILMRTIWCLKKNSLINISKKQHTLLEKLGVIKTETGFYTSEYCQKVFENEFQMAKAAELESVLMLVSATEESKTVLKPIQLAKAIKNSTRTSDVIVHALANKFYILLPKTQLKGAFCVWDKVKAAVGEEFALIAGVSIIGENSFDELKGELLNALVEAEATKNDLVIVGQNMGEESESEDEKSSKDWLDKINASQKNFKLFKQAFSKKLERVITPVFFQMQKLYEEKLYKTQIEQFSNSTLSSFILKKGNNTSELKITYPGFSKISIDVIHQGLDSPENRRIRLDLAELDESTLTRILEEFIAEFKASTEE